MHETVCFAQGDEARSWQAFLDWVKSPAAPENPAELIQAYAGKLASSGLNESQVKAELGLVQKHAGRLEGDLARAGEWADRMVIIQPQDFLQEWGWITCARVRLAQGRYREAQDILETLARLPGSANRILRQVRVDLLLSIVFFYQNQL